MIIKKYVNNSPFLNGGFCDVEMQVGVCVCVCVCVEGGWFRVSVILVRFLCDSCLVL